MKLEEARCHTPRTWTVKGDAQVIEQQFNLSNAAEQLSEIVFDYGCAVGGLPYLETSEVIGEDVQVDIIFSETYAGLSSENGMHKTSPACTNTDRP